MTRTRLGLLYGLGAVAVVFATLLTVARPELAALAVLVVAVVVAATKPLGRLLVFVAGIIALFQSPTVPSTVRALFVAVVVGIAAVTVPSIIRRSRERGIKLGRFVLPVLLIAAVIVAAAVSLLWAPRSIDDWIRDATTYILILVAPIFGLDAALSVKARTLEIVAVVVGIVGAFAYLVAWLSRRGYAILGLEQFALASSLLVIPGIAVCLIRFYAPGRYRFLWGAGAFLQIGMLAASGGRSALVYLGAILLFFVVFGGLIGRWFRRTTALILAGVVAAAVLIPATAAFGLQDFLSGRYDWFENASYEAIQSDLSGQARLRAYGYMWDGFQQSPLFGNGFGVNYTSVTTNVVTAGTYSLDTPVTVLSKFGILGAALLVVAVVLIVRAAGTAGAPENQQRRERWMLLLGSVAVWLALLPSGWPMEQKGFAVQIALLVALSVSWALPAEHSKPSPVRQIHLDRARV